jgi:hypothetical protein
MTPPPAGAYQCDVTIFRTCADEGKRRSQSRA